VTNTRSIGSKTAAAALLLACVVLFVPRAASAATFSATCNGGGCSGGWYRTNVTVLFRYAAGKAANRLVGTSGCGPRTVSSDTAGATFVCALRLSDGTVLDSPPVVVRRDTVPPKVAGSPDRPPDLNGWYNHPVRVTFAGTDGLSGVASCTSAVFAGPDTRREKIGGTCTDYAGNIGAGWFSLKYDSTPPKAPRVAISTNDRFVALRWSVSGDTRSVEITRTPGVSGVEPSVVFSGTASRFADRSVQDGVKYLYSVAAIDRAGNRAVRTIDAVPAAPLYLPTAGTVVHGPPLLAWARVAGASYYNVQIFRRGRKILSAWPTRPRLRLSRAWTFEGRTYRLTHGTYQWRVWPGVGTPSDHRYRPLLGHSTFVVP
jgi:hypothetical protein